MTDLKLWLDIEPYALGRPRARRVGKYVRVYEPKESKQWKRRARALMAEKLGIDIDEPEPAFRSGVPLHVTIMAMFELPKSQHRKKQMPLVQWHTKKKDIDNVAKAVLDAGNGLLWADDSDVALLTAAKMIAKQGDPPCVAVIVRELPEQPSPGIAGWICKED